MLESVILGKQLNKENVDVPIDLEARKKMFLTKAEEKKKEERKRKKTQYDDKKLNTKEISYLLYCDGYTIEEIAEEKVVTAGGRVLGITAKGDTLKEARTKAYAATEWVSFDNKYMRHDIGKAIDEA